MKRTLKTSTIMLIFVVITLMFLSVFNVVYAYFTATASATGSIGFADFDVKLIYYSETLSITQITSKTQLYPSSSLLRGGHSLIKKTSTDTENCTIAVLSGGQSSDAYVACWLEVYLAKNINGKVYYIDSLGNYVDDNGNYVNESGTSITVANKGTLIDYGQYFTLGVYTNGTNGNTTFASNPSLSRLSSTVGGQTKVTYFYKSKITAGGSPVLGSAIQLSANAPSEVLGSSVCIYMSYRAVQASNGAYKTQFSDRGTYYNWG